MSVLQHGQQVGGRQGRRKRRDGEATAQGIVSRYHQSKARGELRFDANLSLELTQALPEEVARGISTRFRTRRVHEHPKAESIPTRKWLSIVIAPTGRRRKQDRPTRKRIKAMKEPKSSTPLQVAASRANGRNGGTKSPDISRWNAVVHALTAKDLTIHEGKHLPEYGQFAAMKRELLQDLARFGALSLEECVAVDKCIADAWRLARAYRFELSETEKADNGMLSPAMPTLLRYINLANRQVAESFARIQEIRKRKEEAAAKSAAAAAHELGGDGQTASEPAAGDTLSETPVSVEPLDTAPATSQPAAAVEGEMPAATEAPEPQGPDRPGS